MRIDLLAKIADNTRLIPKGRFNIHWWIKESECHTVYCAVGYATTLPEFQALGLRMANQGWGNQLEWVDAEGVKHLGMYAVAELIGLTIEQAMSMFHSDGYEATGDLETLTPEKVADRIDEFIAQYCRETGEKVPE